MEKIINTSKEQDKLEDSITVLFSEIYHSFEKETMEGLFNRQVLVFVILWSIFESECIGKSKQLKLENIGSFVKRNHSKIHQEATKDYFNFFDNRYRNNIDSYHFLLNFNRDIIRFNRKNYDMYDIFNKDNLNKYSHCEMLLFLIYIIYRFRCNIFHGNKNIFDWKKDKSPINKCCHALTQIIYNIHPNGKGNIKIPKRELYFL